jgi:DNA polymerase III epsilon subunit-like protein
MRIFVFDTETTGFIDKKESNLDKQPRIIQFAGILGEIENDSFKELEKVNIMINPGVPIPFWASQVHHIYDIDVQNAKKIDEVIEIILHYINTPDIVIGHNIEFDDEMIRLELKRLKREFDYRPKQLVCTMKQTVDFCQLIGNGERFKYPKLWELHKKLFWEYFIWAHDALVDVEATLKCFIELNKTWILTIRKQEAQTLSLF